MMGIYWHEDDESEEVKPFHPEVVHYSPNRAGVRLGVMGTSSFLPGVQIFTALEQKTKNEL